MKPINEYPINFPYAATTDPYSPSRPHRGDDRAAPEGTPIVVAGVQIGLVGQTGLATGPHLHLQEYQGNTANVRKPQNSFQGGTVTAATSSSDFGNYVTIQTEDGWSDSYCHLSRIDVEVGQVIGDEMVVDDALARRLYTLSTLMAQPGAAPDRQPTTKEIEDAIGRDVVAFCDYLINTIPWGANWNKVKHYDEDVKNSGQFKPINQTVYIKE